jgi:cation diffusion facilitator family transporter
MEAIPTGAAAQHIKLRYLRTSLYVGILIAGIKFVSYVLTGSTTLLTDAAESVVNVAAGGFALYAVWLSGRPPDRDHPYGHGKIEFISAGFEGGFIVFAGLGITYQAFLAIRYPHAPSSIGIGIALAALGMVGNGILGYRLVSAGKRYQSMALTADGKHLLSDAFSSVGMLLGLGLMALTQLYWLDGVIALVLAGLLLYHGVGLVRESLRGLLDERNQPLLAQVASVLQAERRDVWIDMHNLRAVSHGPDIHIDAHVTLPWYQNLERSHVELEAINSTLSARFNRRFEVFLHPEPCTPNSCPICTLQYCAVRVHPFTERVNWTSQALQTDANHGKIPPAE